MFNDQGGRIVNGRNTIMTAAHRRGLYHLQVSLIECAPGALLAVNINVLHRWMGHISMHRLKRMVAKKQIKDIDKLTGEPNFCEPCVMGKMKKLPFKRRQTVTQGPLDIIHSNVGGLVMPASPNVYRYWVTFIDVWSRHIWVLFAKKKSDIEELYEKWKAEMKAFFKVEIGTILFGETWTRFLMTDSSGEFTSDTFEEKLKSKGVFHQTTTPDTLESNGMMEHMNQTLVTKTITGLLKTYWAHAMSMATHLITQSPASGVPGEIPYTKLTNRLVDATSDG